MSVYELRSKLRIRSVLYADLSKADLQLALLKAIGFSDTGQGQGAVSSPSRTPELPSGPQTNTHVASDNILPSADRAGPFLSQTLWVYLHSFSRCYLAKM